MLIIIILLIFFAIVLLSIKPECPDCGGKMYDIDLHDGHTVYKCEQCGKEWI